MRLPAVQWLRILLPVQGAMGSNLLRKISCRGATKTMCHDY